MSIAANFNLLNEFNILRLICGLFFIPHIYGKFYVPAALGFFVAAKFKPPKFWMYLSGAIETVLAIGLIFGIYTTICRRDRRHPPLDRHRRRRPPHRQMAMEYRRLRILPVLGDLLLPWWPCTPITPAASGAEAKIIRN